MEEIMFLKIVKGTTIVDATDTLNYVRENPRNKALISCEAILANGIVSTDGTTIWHLEGCPKFTKGSYETVRVEEVCEDEYKSIREALKTSETVSEEVRAQLTTTEMMEKLDLVMKQNEELRAEVSELKQKLAAK